MTQRETSNLIWQILVRRSRPLGKTFKKIEMHGEIKLYGSMFIFLGGFLGLGWFLVEFRPMNSLLFTVVVSAATAFCTGIVFVVIYSLFQNARKVLRIPVRECAEELLKLDIEPHVTQYLNSLERSCVGKDEDMAIFIRQVADYCRKQ